MFGLLQESKKQKTPSSTSTPIYFFLENDKAQLPLKATEGSAGFDLFSCQNTTIESSSIGIIDTGVRWIVTDQRISGFIFPRSSLSKLGISVCLGLIDSDYRGNIKVQIYNQSRLPYSIKEGDRVAQLVLFQSPDVNISTLNSKEEYDQLSSTIKTQRGEGGFGSTGK